MKEDYKIREKPWRASIIQSVSGGIVNILGGGSIDCSE